MFLSTIIPLVFMALSTPSMTEELDKAIESYNKRDRRFGGVKNK